MADKAKNISSSIKIKEEIHLAIVGMVEGNYHPYSWSAIINGYDRTEMEKCIASAIPGYLNKQPKETIGIHGARVTCIWTDNPDESRQIARTCFIPDVVDSPMDVIGKVDAVIIPTDIGSEHVKRAKPFIEFGLPVFIDKPLADNEADLNTFCKWVDEGACIMSSSSARYCKEYMPYRESVHDLGKLEYASITMLKDWGKYGIHGLEGIYTVVGPGFTSVRNTGTEKRNIVHLKHKTGTDVMVIVIYDLSGSYGVMSLCGTAGHVELVMSDSFYQFKAQLADFIQYLKTGIKPYPFAETTELIKMLIAGRISREENGREVFISEIGGRCNAEFA